jgi:hypothetical protein
MGEGRRHPGAATIHRRRSATATAALARDRGTSAEARPDPRRRRAGSPACRRSPALAVVDHGDLIAKMAIRDEQLRMIERGPLKLNPIVRERPGEKLGQRLLAIGAPFQSVFPSPKFRLVHRTSPRRAAWPLDLQRWLRQPCSARAGAPPQSRDHDSQTGHATRCRPYGRPIRCACSAIEHGSGWRGRRQPE